MHQIHSHSYLEEEERQILDAFHRQFKWDHHTNRVDQIVQQEQWQIRGIVPAYPVFDDGDAVNIVLSTTQTVITDIHNLLILVVHDRTGHYHHRAYQQVHRGHRDDDLDSGRNLVVPAENHKNAIDSENKRGNQHVI